MLNPPISSDANLFIIIAVLLIGAVAAVMAVDMYRNFMKEKKQDSSKGQREEVKKPV
ncbi:MAG: hypothetical protein HC819_20345 [Cyclobacteriaceae bacterium]|nr:hypothetical protein [Cyclobacteriaceae bacterium]